MLPGSSGSHEVQGNRGPGISKPSDLAVSHRVAPNPRSMAFKHVFFEPSHATEEPFPQSQASLPPRSPGNQQKVPGASAYRTNMSPGIKIQAEGNPGQPLQNPKISKRPESIRGSSSLISAGQESAKNTSTNKIPGHFHKTEASGASLFRGLHSRTNSGAASSQKQNQGFRGVTSSSSKYRSGHLCTMGPNFFKKINICSTPSTQKQLNALPQVIPFPSKAEVKDTVMSWKLRGNKAEVGRSIVSPVSSDISRKFSTRNMSSTAGDFSFNLKPVKMQKIVPNQQHPPLSLNLSTKSNTSDSNPAPRDSQTTFSAKESPLSKVVTTPVANQILHLNKFKVKPLHRVHNAHKSFRLSPRNSFEDLSMTRPRKNTISGLQESIAEKEYSEIIKEMQLDAEAKKTKSPSKDLIHFKKAHLEHIRQLRELLIQRGQVEEHLNRKDFKTPAQILQRKSAQMKEAKLESTESIVRVEKIMVEEGKHREGNIGKEGLEGGDDLAMLNVEMDQSSLHSFCLSREGGYTYSSNGSEGRAMSEIEQLPPAVILKKMHDFSPTQKILARMESEQTESQYSSIHQGYPSSSLSSTINKDSTIKKGAKYNSPFIHPTAEPARIINPPRLALKLQTDVTDASSSVIEDIMLSSEVDSSQRLQHSDKRSSLRDKYFRSSIGFTSSSGSYSTFKQGSTKTASMALASYFTNSQDEKKRKKREKKVKSLDLDANKENNPAIKSQARKQKKLEISNKQESKEEILFSNKIYGQILRWKMGPIVGFGVSGEVIKAMNIKSGGFFAVKRIQLFQDFESIDPLVVDRLKVEISILKKLRHKNIVRYIGGENDTERGCFYIYLEYIPSGCLRKIYQQFGPFRQNSVRTYARQILEGLEYLHKHNIVHCDLKCANVLVDKNGTIKLSDFGCSHILEQSLTMEQGRITGTWMAPEVILADNTSSQISNAADIWSFGCTLIEMLRAGSPYEEEESEQRAFNGVMKMALSKVSPSPPRGISRELQSLIKQCLQWERKDRPSAKELLLHPFFQE